MAGVRVDVGIPTRSGGPYLDEAIESVLAQTLDSWRLVISENGEGMQELADALAPHLDDERVTHVVTGRDVGMAGNHTRLIQHGSAPYVAILHDDDAWDVEFLERRVRALDANPEAAFAFGKFTTVDGAGTPIATPDVPFPEGLVEPDELLPALVERNVIGISTVVVRRSAYEAVGGEFVADVPMIDYEMWCRLAARFPAYFLDVRDAYWRWHGAQTSQRVGAWGEQWLRFYAHLDAIVQASPTLPVDRELLARRRAASALAAALDALEVDERERAWHHVRTAIGYRRRSMLDPRSIGIAAALPLGRFGTRPLLAARRLTRWGRGRVGPVRRAASSALRRRAPTEPPG